MLECRRGKRIFVVIVVNCTFRYPSMFFQCFPDSSVGKESTYNAGDPSSIPGSGRSARERKGYPLQYSGLENSMNYIVHGVAKSWTQLSDFHFTSLHWREFGAVKSPVSRNGTFYYYLFGCVARLVRS